MKYLASSFSLQMLPEGGHLEVQKISEKAIFGACVGVDGGYTRLEGRYAVRQLIAHSIVGHEATAHVLTKLLGIEVAVNRQAIQLQVGDEIIVAQPTGKRIVYGEEVEEPELAFFTVEVLPAPKSRSQLLASFWDDELEAELVRRQGFTE